MARLNEVPFTDVQITGGFWAPRQEINRTVSIPHSLDMLATSGNIGNLRLAAAHGSEGYVGPVFMDSDLYKALESASYSLATHPDPKLSARMDGIIAEIAAAQRPDGYLDTWYEVNAPGKTWTNLRDHHELYCAGHLIEAAVAHNRATGKRTLLDVAVRVADHIAGRFGPGRHEGYPGHPEIEQALVKLWRLTGNQSYFDLARFFIDHRGEHFFAREHGTPESEYDGTYWQDAVPLRNLDTMVGHAVRCGYLLAGATDVARETGDAGLLAMLKRVWRSTTGRRMYITGGIGSAGANEGFTTDYDLPNLTAYQETCASVAMMMWAHRMNLLLADATYADEVERALYNGMLAGVSQSGSRFFYGNPLESAGDYHRSGWFGCACCPPNATRTIASLGQYAYGTSEDGIWVNLFLHGNARFHVADTLFAVETETQYPWEGRVAMRVRPARPTQCSINVRIPGWCSHTEYHVNGASVAPKVSRGYAAVTREWHDGDLLTVDFDMPARRVAAHPLVKDDVGRLAITRGPLVYCLEGADNGADTRSLSIAADAHLETKWQPNVLGGVTTIHGEGVQTAGAEWPGGLYAAPAPSRPARFSAIPYHAWDNREAGPMLVWVPTAPLAPPAGGPERSAKVTMSFVSPNCQPYGVNDGSEPVSSGEQPAALCHWWPHKGTTEWVQYTWRKAIPADGAEIYWFDDTGRGECRLPVSWRLLARSGDAWQPVALEAGTAYDIAPNRWIKVRFTPVRTDSLRLEAVLKPGWAAGVRQWRVDVAEADD